MKNRAILCLALAFAGQAGCTSIDNVKGYDADDALKLSILRKSEETQAIQTDVEFLQENPFYWKFARLASQEYQDGSYSAFEAARLNSKSHQRSIYPTLEPSASMNQKGESIARVTLTQTLYSGGTFRADTQYFDANENVALASHLAQTNEVVADSIIAYFEAYNHGALEGISGFVLGHYDHFISMADQRVFGGITDATELANFELKRLEAKSELLDHKAQKEILKVEVGTFFEELPHHKEPPAIVPRAASIEPPELLEAQAKVDLAASEVARKRSSRLPRVSLDLVSQQNLDTGENTEDVSLGVGVSLPLGGQKGFDVQSSLAELQSAEANLEAMRVDIEKRLALHQSKIGSNQSRIAALSAIKAKSLERIGGFEELFLSGAVSLKEASSYLESYKKAAVDLAQAKHDIRVSQVHIAKLRGQLVPAVE